MNRQRTCLLNIFLNHFRIEYLLTCCFHYHYFLIEFIIKSIHIHIYLFFWYLYLYIYIYRYWYKPAWINMCVYIYMHIPISSISLSLYIYITETYFRKIYSVLTYTFCRLVCRIRNHVNIQAFFVSLNIFKAVNSLSK